MKRVTIDRFEGTFAVCEDGEGRFFALEAGELPAGAGEGTALLIDDAQGTLQIDETETAKKRDKNRRLEDKLFH